MKLILGTANFGTKAYGMLKEPLSLVDIRFILEYAKNHGITMLEGGEAYGCDELLTDLHFDLIYKVTHPYNLDRVLERTKRKYLTGLMYHHGLETQSNDVMFEPSRMYYHGASIYHAGQLNGRETMVEVPLNLENKEFEKLTAPCKLVRSIFGRGELLKNHSVRECIAYVKSLPNVDGVVVGVDSVVQLKEILEAWNG